ncbi:hypothetical protein ABE38_24685 [Brevibacillus agri]|nr:hypothetical protein [Brevibacillus agri]
MKRIFKKFIREETGSVNVLILTLLFLVLSIMIMVRSVDFFTQVIETNRVKRDLALATHAAAMDVDKVKLADGILALVPSQAIDSFFTYLQKNMRLNAYNIPQSDSYIEEAPIIHKILYVDYEARTIQALYGSTSNCSLSGKTISCTVVANAGTEKEATRTVNELLVGPSVVSVIEVSHNRFSMLDPEPIVVADTQQVLYGY